MTQFEHQNAAGLDVSGGLRNEWRIEFVAFIAAEEGDGGFVFAHFARKRGCFTLADVRRVADDRSRRNAWCPGCGIARENRSSRLDSKKWTLSRTSWLTALRQATCRAASEMSVA